ncbi:hypothetical protein [Helicobacter sp. 11S03491-1]|uniref:hypothetical protein n=1 Tax=Helicobacter sp. 11S03491-1 TaxID=1476196 RepID=UPI000BA72F62|nr:hypothetical protein [Helicobacter sp. 11S03491-1]PAF41442.1 hypothetical protein BKH45_06890 [Helicobacter sp. 11S03491-1]
MNDEKFEEFLKNISKDLNEEEDYQKVIIEAKNVYKDDYRHPYSLITTYILKNTTNDEDKERLSQNIRWMVSYIIKNQDKKHKIKIEEDKKLLTNLKKLEDHINLDFIHLRYYEEKFSTFNVSLEKQKESLKVLVTTNEKLENDLKNQKNQYITILGIFASIVLAFVGVFTFSTSIFSNIDKSSIYRLIFVMAFIVCLFTNLLYFLFDFIKNIGMEKRQRSFKEHFVIVSFNILILIVLICNGGFYLFIEKLGYFITS